MGRINKMLKFTITLVYLSLSYIFVSAIKRNTKNKDYENCNNKRF